MVQTGCVRHACDLTRHMHSRADRDLLHWASPLLCTGSEVEDGRGQVVVVGARVLGCCHKACCALGQTESPSREFEKRLPRQPSLSS